MKHSDRQNARDESDRATREAILKTMSSGIELFRAVQENDSLRRWIYDMVFNTTYIPPQNSSGNKKAVIYTTDSPAMMMVAEPSPSYGKKSE